MASHDQGYRDREAKGQAQEKTGQTMEAMKDKAEAAKNKASETAQAAKEKMGAAKDGSCETAEAGKEKTAGILQQTGEQVKHMAQGAADAVKHTLGMGENKNATATNNTYDD